jgi:hypothetical protein
VFLSSIALAFPVRKFNLNDQELRTVLLLIRKRAISARQKEGMTNLLVGYALLGSGFTLDETER